MLNDPKLLLQSISRFVNAAEILERNNYDVLEADNRQQDDYPLVDLDISLASHELQAMLKNKAAQATNAQLSADIIVVRASWLEAISGALEEYADCLDGNHDFEGRWCNVCGEPSSANAHTNMNIEHECSQCHRPLAILPDGAPEICNCDGQYDI